MRHDVTVQEGRVKLQILAFILGLFLLFLTNASFGAEKKAGVEIVAVSSPWSIALIKIRNKVNEGVKADVFGGCTSINTERILAKPLGQIWEFTVRRVIDIKLDLDIPIEQFSNSRAHIEMIADQLTADNPEVPLDYKEELTDLMFKELKDQRQIRIFLSLHDNPKVLALADTDSGEVLIVTQSSFCQ